MSLIYIGPEDSNAKKSNRYSYSSNRSNSFFSSKKNNRSDNRSPIYTRNFNNKTAKKGAGNNGLWDTIKSAIKSVFHYLYLLITDFSIQRVIDLFSLLLGFIKSLLLMPFIYIYNNKVILTIVIVIFVTLCLGYVIDISNWVTPDNVAKNITNK